MGGSGRTYLNIGYWIPPYGSGRISGVDGNIDSEVTSALEVPGRSTWTFQAVKFCANRCENLDVWYVNHDAGPDLYNYLQMFEYFEARQLYFEGSASREDRIEVTYDPAATPSGLRVLQHVILQGTDPNNDEGPSLYTGDMLVRRQTSTDDPAMLIIENASKVEVTMNHGLNKEEAPQTVNPAFKDESILVYGTMHEAYDP